jgi:membrane protease YdiL (CAAX protease family)
MSGRPPNVIDAGVVLFGFFLVLAILPLVTPAGEDVPAWVRSLFVILRQLLWLGVAFGYAAWARIDFRRAFYLRRLPIGVLPRLLILWLAASWLIVWIHSQQSLLFEWIGIDFRPAMDRQMEEVRKLMTLGTLISIAIIAFLAAVQEELVFRGIILRGLSGNVPRVRAAIYSALVFAAAHQLLPRMTITFFLGVVFALVVLWTGSIVAAILLHILNNVGSLLLMSHLSGSPHPLIVIVALAAFILSLGSLYFRRHREDVALPGP